jgi:hypothetical protein
MLPHLNPVVDVASGMQLRHWLALQHSPVGCAWVAHAAWPDGQPPHTLLPRHCWSGAQQRLPQTRDFGQQTLFPCLPRQVRP